MMNIRERIYLVLMIISIVISGYIVWSKGINFNTYNTNHQEQYQQQFQGQLSMNMFMARGDKIIWNYKKVSEFSGITDYCKFLETLDPTSSYFKETVCMYDEKVYPHGMSLYLVWPSVVVKTEEKIIPPED